MNLNTAAFLKANNIIKCQSSAFGKVVLTGEHGVVYGSKAIGMPLTTRSMTMDLQIINQEKELNTKANNKKSLFRLSHRILVAGKDYTNELLPTLLDALDLLSIKTSPIIKISIDSDIPLGAGLGASASMCLNFINSLKIAFNLPLSFDQINQLANKLEQRFHGTPSGLDVSIISHKRLISFEKNKPVSYINQPNYFYLALINSKIYSSTKIMLNSSNNLINKNSLYKKYMIDSFNQAHDLIIEGCKNLDHNKIIQSFNLSKRLLKDLKVSNEHLSSIMNKLLNLGVLAVKPTGSGGGGFVLALLPSNVQKIHNVIEKIYNTFGKSNTILITL